MLSQGSLDILLGAIAGMWTLSDDGAPTVPAPSACHAQACSTPSLVQRTAAGMEGATGKPSAHQQGVEARKHKEGGIGPAPLRPRAHLWPAQPAASQPAPGGLAGLRWRRCPGPLGGGQGRPTHQRELEPRREPRRRLSRARWWTARLPAAAHQGASPPQAHWKSRPQAPPQRPASRRGWSLHSGGGQSGRAA